MSNRKNDSIYHGHRTSLNEDVKHRIFTINKCCVWYNKYSFSMVFITRMEEQVKAEVKSIYM